MAIQTEQDALKALDAIEVELTKSRAAGIDMAVLCATYRTIKPFLEGSLWLLGRIPVIGTKLTVTVSFLIQIADLACPL